MKTIALTLLLLPLPAGAAENPTRQPQAAASALMQGKEKTARTIFLEVIVNAPPPEVYRLWTSPEGIKQFFAPDARIDPAVGGRYEILFAPGKDPEGESHGTKGARILKLLPDRELAFEWITFAGDELLGKNAPPYAPPAQRNIRPLPTWAEVSFEAVEGDPNRTRVRFAHYGFGEGELWGRSYEWFTRAWKGVLEQLGSFCNQQAQKAEKKT